MVISPGTQLLLEHMLIREVGSQVHLSFIKPDDKQCIILAIKKIGGMPTLNLAFLISSGTPFRLVRRVPQTPNFLADRAFRTVSEV